MTTTSTSRSKKNVPGKPGTFFPTHREGGKDPPEKDKMNEIKKSEFFELFAERWIYENRYLLLINFVSIIFSAIFGKSMLAAVLV